MSVIGILNKVVEGSIVLPNIQRKFVWKDEKITKLMDSIMRGYPIGIILMWETFDNIQYRKFTSSYTEEAQFDYHENPENQKLSLVLDGQQRLQSLFIALYGKYNGKELYLELLSGQEQDDSAEIKYEFQFLTDEEAKRLNDESVKKFSDPKNDDPSTVHEKSYYYKTSRLINITYDNILILIGELKTKLRLDNNEQNLIQKNIHYLKDNLQSNEHILRYSTLDENKQEQAVDRKNPSDILEVFVRVNREGTRLSKSDLIFSMLKLNWKDSAIDLPKFVDMINKNNSFDFDKDFVIKCLFAVSDFGPKYDIDILRIKSTVEKIKNNFATCCDAIKSCVDFVRQECWINSDKVLPGYNILIPFVYYLFHLPKHIITESDITNVRKFFYVSAFTRLFTRYAESRIKIYIRDYLKPQIKRGEINFSYKEGLNFLRRYESFKGIDDDLLNDNLYLVLNLIQRNFDMDLLYDKNEPEIDHIFPKSILREKGWDEYKTNFYANYWYLPKNQNRNKSNKHPRDFFNNIKISRSKLEKLFIYPDLLDYRRYSTFCGKRSQKIRDHIKTILGISEEDIKLEPEQQKMA